MINSSYILRPIVVFLLILLWTYTGTSKLMTFLDYSAAMYKQPLNHFIATLLIWSLPPLEIVLAALLLFDKSRLPALYLSLMMMFVFTVYVALAVLNFYKQIPCSCGGVLKELGWRNHLWFNIFFLLLSALGIYMTNRERRMVGAD